MNDDSVVPIQAPSTTGGSRSDTEPEGGETLDLAELLAQVDEPSAGAIVTALHREMPPAREGESVSQPGPDQADEAGQADGIRFLPIDTRGLKLRKVGPDIFRYKKGGYLAGRNEDGLLTWMTFTSYEQALSWHNRAEEHTDF